MNTLQERRKEFEAKIWDHAADAFQVQFDAAPELSDLHQKAIGLLVKTASTLEDDGVTEAIRQYVVVLASEAPDEAEAFVNRLLQLSGLTRNKVLTDVRAALSAASGQAEAVPSSTLKAVLSKKTGTAATAAVSARLLPLLRMMGELAAKDQRVAVSMLNHATWPGYIRQERAKRQGHEAEGLLARLLRSLRVPFEPSLKAENPLTADATIAGHSFDLVTPSAAKPKVCVKSTVHTSNIGQYGESKDKLEIEEGLAALTKAFGAKRPKLVAMVDGVGLLSNIEGLTGVLTTADEFCQFRTVWKFGLLALAASPVDGVTLHLPPADIKRYSAFLAENSAAAGVFVQPLGGVPKTGNPIQAGEGVFTVQS